ncbi:hypothetical protein NDU88_004279 [Pleurodeles waltl]|uniref:Uncharacterized protein n=1 Tax=Pleurodeles waltl TaxID=8319 RepID=A0AAV7WRE4_PLEWA|nr:hypothetical protein NDU88_004279 [Pleurodeles waltl]
MQRWAFCVASAAEDITHSTEVPEESADRDTGVIHCYVLLLLLLTASTKKMFTKKEVPAKKVASGAE